MAFATTGRSDVRRRRVLMQSNGTPELAPASSSSSRASSDAGEKRLYHETAQRAFQPALTSLIPRRPLTHFLSACVGLAVLLLLLDAWAVSLEHRRLLSDLLFLNPAASASLMGWVVNGLCVAAAVTAGLIYLVRRHRVDDYRGRYRWWLWVVGCCLLASADATTNFSAQLAHVAALASGNRLLIPPSAVFCWPALVGGLLGSFLLRELVESKIAMTLLLAAGSSAFFTAIVMSQRLPICDPVLAAMAIATGRFLSVWLTASGLLWYARHVDLSAHGLLPAAPATRASSQTAGSDKSTGRASAKEPSKARAKKTAKKQAASRPTADSEPEPATRSRAASKPSKQDKVAASASHDSVEPEEGSEDEYRGLSKSERRRLRKQKRRAARRQAA